ncbi:MAG: YDG domain-containing protein, partial [Planctomycetota bacterium]
MKPSTILVPSGWRIIGSQAPRLGAALRMCRVFPLLLLASSLHAATLTQNLLVTANSGGSPVNTTATLPGGQGMIDWVHWGNGAVHGLDRKANVNGLITDYILVGGTPVANNIGTNLTGFIWTDGTPTAAKTEAAGAGTALTCGSAVGDGFQFIVAASTAVQTLKVYVGVYSGTAAAATTGTLYLSLSDSSAGPVADSTLTTGATAGVTVNGVYTITFAAGSAGQMLTVNWNSAALGTGGWISLGAAVCTSQLLLSDCSNAAKWVAKQHPGPVTTMNPSVTETGGHDGSAINISFPAITAGNNCSGMITRNDNDDPYYQTLGSTDSFDGLAFWVHGDGSTNWGVLDVMYSAGWYHYYALFPVTTTWTEVVIPWREFYQFYFLGPIEDNYKQIFSIGFRNGDIWPAGPPTYTMYWNDSAIPAMNYDIDEIRFVNGLTLAPTPVPNGSGIDNTVTKLRAGQPVKIVVMGSAISAGKNNPSPATRCWPSQLQGLLVTQFGYTTHPNDITVVNNSRSGGKPSVMGASMKSWQAGSMLGWLVFDQPNTDLFIGADWGYNDVCPNDENNFNLTTEIVRNYQNLYGVVLRHTPGIEAMYLHSGLNCQPGTIGGVTAFNALDPFYFGMKTLCNTMNVFTVDAYGDFQMHGENWLETSPQPPDGESYYTGNYEAYVYPGHTRVAQLICGAMAKVAVITLGSLNQTYNGTPESATATTNPLGLTVTFTYNGSATPPTNAGSYAVVATVNDGTYLGTHTGTLTISPAPLTVTAAANTKTYDGTTSAAAAPTITAGTLQGTDTANFTETYDTKNVGTGKTLTPAGTVNDGNSGNNYTYTFAPSATGVITAATLTVTGITANSKVYDGTTAATLTGTPGTLVGVIGGDTVSLSGTAVGTFVNKDVGSGKTVTVSGQSLTGAQAGNYSLTEPATTANITPFALTVSGIGASGKVYDGTTAATLTGTPGALVGVFSGDTVSLSGTAVGTFVDKNVGTGKTVTVSGQSLTGPQAADYSVTEPTPTANITAYAITVKAASDSKTYDGTTTSVGVPTITSGVLQGADTASWTQAFDTKNAGANKTLTPAGAVNDGNGGNDYAVTFTPVGTGTITAKTLTVSGIGASDKVYDGTTTATLTGTPGTLVGVVGADTVSLSGTAVGTFANKDVGNGKTVTVSGQSLTGPQAGNYSLTEPATTASITPFSLTVSGIGANNKTYDGGTTATLTGTPGALQGVFSGDTVSLSGTAVGTFADKDAGSGKTVTVSGQALTGAQAGDYSLTEPATTANITPLALTVSGIGANNKTYDGGTTATLTGTPG